MISKKQLHSYDKYIVCYSGGKDSTAMLLWLLLMGIKREKIELWHQSVDGNPTTGQCFMDWQYTPAYCKAFADTLGVPLFFQWKSGGFLKEMLRKNSRTAPTYFESPDSYPDYPNCAGGSGGKCNTRRKFPQITADLKTRWCSAYLKIDVCSIAIRNQKRFNNSRTFVLTGERAEESPARAKYKIFETDRADARDGKKKRLVDHLRPIKDWKEEKVWAMLKHHKILPHPAYFLGWNRLSCKFCIFGNSDQMLSAHEISPDTGRLIMNYEREFGVSIKREMYLSEFISLGKLYDMDPALIKAALSKKYMLPIIVQDWQLPQGAFKDGLGPT